MKPWTTPSTGWLLLLVLVSSRPVEDERGESSGTVPRDPWIAAEMRRMIADNATSTPEEDKEAEEEATGLGDDDLSSFDASSSIESPEDFSSAFPPETEPPAGDASIDEDPIGLNASAPAAAPDLAESKSSPTDSPLSSSSSGSSQGMMLSTPSPSVPPVEPPSEATESTSGTGSVIAPESSPAAPGFRFTSGATDEGSSDDTPSDDDYYDSIYSDDDSTQDEPATISTDKISADTTPIDDADSDEQVDDTHHEDEGPSSPSTPESYRGLEREKPSDTKVLSQGSDNVVEVETSKASRSSGMPAAVVVLLTLSTVAIMGAIGFYVVRLWKRRAIGRYRGWRPYDFELIEL